MKKPQSESGQGVKLWDVKSSFSLCLYLLVFFRVAWINVVVNMGKFFYCPFRRCNVFPISTDKNHTFVRLPIMTDI